MGRGSFLRGAAVALLVVLAGCGMGQVGSQGASPTVTPAPVPETATDGRLAPGVTDEGVRSPETLAAAHTAFLENRSYTLVANRTVRYRNGTVRSRFHIELALGADRGYLVGTATEGHRGPVYLGRPPARASFWSNGSRYARQLSRENSTVYNEFEPIGGAGEWQYWARTVPFGGSPSGPERFFESTFGVVTTRVAGQISGAEPSAYRVVGSRATDSIEGVDDVRAVRLEAVVTAKGFVRSMRLSYEGTVDGRPVTVSRTVQYRAIGETRVERPAWVDRALGQASEG